MCLCVYEYVCVYVCVCVCVSEFACVAVDLHVRLDGATNY